MSRENVDIVKAVHPPSGTKLSDLFSEGSDGPGLDALAALLTSDFEVVAGVHGGIWVEARGFDGLLQTWRDWLEPWDEYSTTVERFVDVDEDKVLVLVRDHGRPRGSKSRVELAGGSVWTLRGGKIARIEFHATRESALEAAGLTE